MDARYEYLVTGTICIFRGVYPDRGINTISSAQILR